MSNRVALLTAVLVIAGLALGLGYYLGHHPPAPEETVAAIPVPGPKPTTTPLPLPAPPSTVQRDPSQNPLVNQLRERYPQTGIAVVGGEEILLHVRWPLEKDRLVVHDDSISGGFFDRLSKAAREGDDGAAHYLYDSLNTCKKYPKTRAEFDAAIEKGRKWYAQSGGVEVTGEKPQDWDEWSKNMEGLFHRCEGVTDDMYPTATQLLRESVERGCDDNRFYYARAIESTDPDAAREQYEILAQKGYVSGMQALGKTSLAYQIASIVAMGTLREQPSGARDQLLSKLEASTSPSTFQEASKEAAQILKNPNCCRIY